MADLLDRKAQRALERLGSRALDAQHAGQVIGILGHLSGVQHDFGLFGHTDEFRLGRLVLDFGNGDRTLVQDTTGLHLHTIRLELNEFTHHEVILAGGFAL